MPRERTCLRQALRLRLRLKLPRLRRLAGLRLGALRLRVAERAGALRCAALAAVGERHLRLNPLVGRLLKLILRERRAMLRRVHREAVRRVVLVDRRVVLRDALVHALR